MKKKKNFTLGKDWTTQFQLHTLMLPGTVCIIVFSILPLFGLILAFKNYSVVEGVAGIFTSKWYGFQNFKIIFGNHDFTRMLVNTLGINLLGNLINIPAALFFALLINEIASPFLKKSVQTLTYMPHFISWAALAGIFIDILSPSGGIVNQLITTLGMKSVFFLGDSGVFPYTMAATDIWKELGWGTIVYLAAITGIDPTYYEAARMDGAGKFKQVLYVTIPGILPMILLMMVLSVGNVLQAGFEQVFNLYSPQVYSTGDIIDTYVYRIGVIEARFDLATAVGLFKSAISFVLIMFGYKLADKLAGYKVF